MMNPKFPTIDDYVDVETLNHFDILQKTDLVSKKLWRLSKSVREIIVGHLCNGMIRKMLALQLVLHG